MLMANVGPKSVNGRYVGPLGLEVRKFVVFHTPPLAPATNTVLPVESEGSSARPPMRPEFSLLLLEAGPTEVHVPRESGLLGSIVKMRKLTVAWSATVSPSPVSERGLRNVGDQLSIEPRPGAKSWISSIHVPPERSLPKP